MELLEQVQAHWQYIAIGVVIILGFCTNLFDKKPINRVNFTYTELPSLKPLPIPTKDKGFWGAIWLWLTGVRQWEVSKDFRYTLNGENFVIPKGFQFDGASVPKFLAIWLSPVGVLLMGGLIHDYGYKYETLLKQGKRETVGILTQREMDQIFRDINVEVNGFLVLNYLAYFALRLAGFIAWKKHRKNNCQIDKKTR